MEQKTSDDNLLKETEKNESHFENPKRMKLTSAWNKITTSKSNLFSELEQFKFLLESEETRLLQERKTIEEEKSYWEMEKEEMTRRFSSVLTEKRIQLDVGGHFFSTTLQTLTKVRNTMLASMFSGRFELKTAEDGRYFIDRDGTHFRYILNYLRDLELELPSDIQIRKELLREAQYYNIEGLIQLLMQQDSPPASSSFTTPSPSSFSSHTVGNKASSNITQFFSQSNSGPISSLSSSTLSVTPNTNSLSSSVASCSPSLLFNLSSSSNLSLSSSSTSISIPWKWEPMHLGESVYHLIDDHIVCKNKMNGTICALRAQPGFPVNSSQVIRWKIEIENYEGDDLDLGVCNELCNGNKEWLRADLNALGLCQANTRRSRFSQLHLYPNCSFSFAYEPTFRILEVISNKGERASWNIPDNWNIIYPALAIRKIGCRVTITSQ